MHFKFNLFDLWGAVVTSRPEVKTLKDLEGKQLAAARATTNFVMFEFFAKQMGVDKSKIQVVNTAPPGLVGYALADQARLLRQAGGAVLIFLGYTSIPVAILCGYGKQVLI